MGSRWPSSRATTELAFSLMAGSILGNSVRRVEDPRILSGATQYLDDLQVAGCLHAVFVRSNMAHARLGGVDTTEAATAPGVVAVITAEELGLEPQRPMPVVPAAFARPLLATDTVRFVGEPIAVVIAETRAQAVDAAELVVVDYDPLPAVADPVWALDADAPVLFPEHGSNIASESSAPTDPELFAGADVVVSGRFINQRLAAVPMESNGILVIPEHPSGKGGGEELTCWVSTQSPFWARGAIAQALGLKAESVRVVAPAVGGGFGAKPGAVPEQVVIAAIARRLDRPVRFVETRSENLMAMTHGRAQVQDVEIGATRDGVVVGLRVRAIQDAGAYPAVAAFLVMLTRQMASGVYRIPKIEFSSVTVATNTTPIGAYRGAGRPEATALIERAMDMVAAELGLDPVDVRRKNLIPADAFPYTTVTGANYDVGDYERALDEALRLAGYDDLRKEQAERRGRGDRCQLGIGVSCYVEVTAGGMTSEFGSVEVHEDGTVTVKTGTSPHGQGHETAWAQIAADQLGVPIESVRVLHSDTALISTGSGTMGSRSAQVGGSAVFRATEGVVAKAKLIAAHLLEAAPDDIVVHDGAGVGVVGAPVSAIAWAGLAKAANDPKQLPEGMEPGLLVDDLFDQGVASYPFGAHVAVTEVDMDTGKVRLLRHIAVDDCGRVLNPMLARGQVHGGVAQGVAQALFEGVSYDEDGNPLTASLIDYKMPSAAEFPSFETAHTETPTPLNPLGAKGIGESGTIGSTPAVQSSVVDALAHLGVRHLDMPLTPERVWRAIQAATPR